MANVLPHQSFYFGEPHFGSEASFSPAPSQRSPGATHYSPWGSPVQTHEPMGSPQMWQQAGRKAVLQPRKHHMQPELSRTNIYISGLKADTTDEDLKHLCSCFGEIISTKAIIDRDQNVCKGYGFVMFDQEASARLAIETLLRSGTQATFAKMTRAQVEYQRSEVDPTNLYFTNLHKDMDESQLMTMLMQCLEMVGEVVSCRVLRDELGFSRGVGLARLDSREACELIIARLNGYVLPGCLEPMRVKYANSPAPRRAGPKIPGRQQSSYFYRDERGVASDSSPVVTPAISVSDFATLSFEDDPVVPDAAMMHALPPRMRNVSAPPLFNPHAAAAAANSNASRLSAWVGSSKEDLGYVPLASPPSHAGYARAAPAPAMPYHRHHVQQHRDEPAPQYELEFALDGSATGLAQLLDDM